MTINSHFLHLYKFSYEFIVNSLDASIHNSNCTDFDVQLVDGDFPNEGKVSVCINGVWGLVCRSSFTSTDASVICNQLGYSSFDGI